MTDTSPEAIAAIEQSNRRQHFTDVRHVAVRWEPYQPDGARQMKAKGRWQEQVGSGDYWRWQNCERPAFAHDPDAEAACIAALEAEALDWRAQVGELSDQVKALRAENARLLAALYPFQRAYDLALLLCKSQTLSDVEAMAKHHTPGGSYQRAALQEKPND
jgi:hypothetical protein